MKTWRVVAAGVALFLILAAFFGYLFLTRPRPVLTVATWPESYGHAQASAQLVPFAAVSGTNVLIAVYDGGTKELARQVASHQYKWDVMDLENTDAVSACEQGLLERLDSEALPQSPKGLTASRDFVPGAIGPCWVASVVYAHVVAAVPSLAQKPARLTDFFDTKTFPGKRALNAKNAKYNLEMALLADGVAPEKLYAELATPEGLSRAIAKLASLKADIVWCNSPAEEAQALADGRAVMAYLPSWAVFDADNDPAAHFKLNIVWDRQLYEVEAFGIPKGNPKAAKAFDFIRYATRAENLGRMASWIAYGPARKSALAYVGPNPDLKIAMTPYLPTAHFETAVAVQESFWQKEGARIAPAWQSFTEAP